MLDSDINNADSQLHVEFYNKDSGANEGKPYVRIMAPGDKTNIIDQPVRDDHKQRFPRQWLYFQMQQNEGAAQQMGTPLTQWHKDSPEDINRDQIAELNILKFVTVEQLALASDGQLQRVGMGGIGLREKARQYLNRKNRADSNAELEQTKQQLVALQAQMAELLAEKPRRGRPPKELTEG
ncbi:MAG: hypothetical protein EB148_02300 [Actinobacteria bacterium]|jgi:hypothetical protein|nr:hypothetical protein [Actinomycetota bacterium]NDE81359.1 hypothetical protein [Actinomycetota bacterium]NDF23290.1 hypothetical protein [Actinomycetota bacterium]